MESEDSSANGSVEVKATKMANSNCPGNNNIAREAIRERTELSSISTIHQTPIIAVTKPEQSINKKKLRKRMASDTDLWVSLRANQERYSRMVSVANAANKQSQNKEMSQHNTG